MVKNINAKNFNRRDFVKTLTSSGIGIAGLGLMGSGLSACAAEGSLIKNMGVQLYTVRDQMKVDLEGTVAKVAEIGYKEVEFAGYFGKTAKEIKAILDQNGLISPSVHISLNDARNMAPVIDYAKEVGHEYLVIGWLAPNERETADQYRSYIDILNKADEECRNAGIQFGYHNHAFEFAMIEDLHPYDFFLENTDMKMEVDLYWTEKAGVDMNSYYEKYPGRFPLCHIKDMGADGKYTDPGRGNLDFKALLKNQKLAGLKHFFIENDEPVNSMEAIDFAYNYVKGL